MDSETEVQLLKALFEKLGSSSEQALVMARQVSKRATQVSEEREVSRTEAMQYLIELVTKGSSGISSNTFLGEEGKE